jgi:hypothetical protein
MQRYNIEGTGIDRGMGMGKECCTVMRGAEKNSQIWCQLAGLAEDGDVFGVLYRRLIF